MPKSNSVRVPATHCPHCQAKLSGAAHFDFETTVRPKPGDFSVCLKCAGMLRFGAGLKLEALSVADFWQLPALERAQIDQMRRKVRRLLLREATRKAAH